MSPFVADLGYSPKLPADLQLPTDQRAPASKFLIRMESILRNLQAQLRSSAERMKLQYDKGRRDQKFEVGDMVLISTKDFNPKTVGAVQRKFAAKWIGPYEILRVLHDGASYELSLPHELRIHPVFHTMVLKRFVKDATGCSRDSTIPTVRLKDGSEGHLIEEIIDHRIKRDGTEQYRCKWVGKADDITWEPTTNLFSVPGLIREYHRRAKGLPIRVSKRLQDQKQHHYCEIRSW
ncbi:hypothetical protein ON010_g17314 [Phytophthora cinnamomi]|nr:hypothetical protein ON010_g17314 [Phytophthora cinnamomi]